MCYSIPAMLEVSIAPGTAWEQQLLFDQVQELVGLYTRFLDIRPSDEEFSPALQDMISARVAPLAVVQAEHSAREGLDCACTATEGSLRLHETENPAQVCAQLAAGFPRFAAA